MKRCVRCKTAIDYPGCDDCDREDANHPGHCRACGGHLDDEAEYAAHLKRGGRPYQAWLVGSGGQRIRRLG